MKRFPFHEPLESDPGLVDVHEDGFVASRRWISGPREFFAHMLDQAVSTYRTLGKYAPVMVYSVSGTTMPLASV